jgi:hypothetical protein
VGWPPWQLNCGVREIWSWFVSGGAQTNFFGGSHQQVPHQKPIKRVQKEAQINGLERFGFVPCWEPRLASPPLFMVLKQRRRVCFGNFSFHILFHPVHFSLI